MRHLEPSEEVFPRTVSACRPAEIAEQSSVMGLRRYRFRRVSLSGAAADPKNGPALKIDLSELPKAGRGVDSEVSDI